MERRRKPSLVSRLLCFLWVALPFGVLSQEGFISIDCGYGGQSYTDSERGLTYTDDAPFIVGGEKINLRRNPFEGQYGTLRSFPENIRNCYKLYPVKKGGKYLIRAGFYYGNYDSKDLPPTFDLRVGVNFWTAVQMGSDNRVVYEIITISTGDDIQVCLYNTVKGTPFISLLELRSLPGNVYPLVNGSQSLVLQNRWNYGANDLIRYPDDHYDRIWDNATALYSYSVNTTRNIEMDAGDAFNVPWKVLSTATSFHSLFMGIISPVRTNPGEEIYIIMHVAGLLQLKPNESVTNIYGGDDKIPLFQKYTPRYLKVDHKEVLNVTGNSGFYNISFYSDSSSMTYRYDINALESYILRPTNESQTELRDVSAIEDIKKAFMITRNWESDPCSPGQYSWNGVGCSYNGSGPARITSINLSSSSLSGEIPPSLGQLTALRSLDLSENNLRGPIPEGLGMLLSLQFLNLSGNDAIRAIPRSFCERAAQGTLTISLKDWPQKCKDSISNNKDIIIPIMVGISVTVINALVVSLWLFYRKKKAGCNKAEQKMNQTKANDENYLKKENPKFKYSEIKKITQNFRNEIGRGGFGTVYLGKLRDGTRVAVKVLSSSSTQGNKEFEAEVQLLARVHHKNLVSLVGYCDDAQHLCLVYEYIDNGTLRDHISGKKIDANPLNWTQRINIALQAAQGLDYLHNGCKPPIVHRDIKSTNILLNGGLMAKISDFGLSRAIRSDNSTTQVTSKIAGTPGYLDPLEVHNYGLSEKSDVYSFGVVLLEILTGQPAYVVPVDKIHIIQWVALKVEAGDIRNIIDPTLNGLFDAKVAWKLIEVAMSCTSTNVEERITMSNVVLLLKQCLEMNEPPQYDIEADNPVKFDEE